MDATILRSFDVTIRPFDPVTLRSASYVTCEQQRWEGETQWALTYRDGIYSQFIGLFDYILSSDDDGPITRLAIAEGRFVERFL